VQRVGTDRMAGGYVFLVKTGHKARTKAGSSVRLVCSPYHPRELSVSSAQWTSLGVRRALAAYDALRAVEAGASPPCQTRVRFAVPDKADIKLREDRQVPAAKDPYKDSVSFSDIRYVRDLARARSAINEAYRGVGVRAEEALAQHRAAKALGLRLPAEETPPAGAPAAPPIGTAHPSVAETLSQIAADPARDLDPETGLFQDADAVLEGPPARLARALADEVAAEAPKPLHGDIALARRLLTHPFAAAFLLEVIRARAKALDIPPEFAPEIYRALLTLLLRERPGDAQMREILACVREGCPEARLAQVEVAKHLGRLLSRAPEDPGVLRRLGFFLRAPGDHLRRALRLYARRKISTALITLLKGATRIVQAGLLALTGTLVALVPEALSLARELLALPLDFLERWGVLPMTLVGLVLGGVLFGFGLLRMPDWPRRLGRIGERDAKELEARLDTLHPQRLEPL